MYLLREKSYKAFSKKRPFINLQKIIILFGLDSRHYCHPDNVYGGKIRVVIKPKNCRMYNVHKIKDYL